MHSAIKTQMKSVAKFLLLLSASVTFLQRTVSPNKAALRPPPFLLITTNQHPLCWKKFEQTLIFLGAWQTTDVFVFLADWSAHYIVKSPYSLNENGATPADGRHFCCVMAFMGLSWLNTRNAGKCQVFEEVRQKLQFSALCSTFRPRFALAAVMSAPQGWVAQCDPLLFMCALFLFSLYPHPEPWICSVHGFDHFQDLAFSLGQNLEVW